jgi:TonB family protein
MSVEPSEATSEVWTRWQGHVINGAFPLGRCLGSSDHSGVFLTRSEAHDLAAVAIKLVPTNRALAEQLLPRWKRAGALPHPHLLPLLQWGGCQLEGLPYLYALMEYADQTLAQLLPNRALTDDEAREMLHPILAALGFLHAQDLVQGQLKPANILVVGDQLKLASDTIRRVGEGAVNTHAPTAYDPPEGRQGNTSPAGDVWALGVTLCEALGRRVPSGTGESKQAAVLPADFSPAFREIVTRCLSFNPQDRPSVTELAAFARGESAQSPSTDTILVEALAPPPVPGPVAPEASASEPAADASKVVPPAPEPPPPSAPAPTLPAAMHNAADEARHEPSGGDSLRPRAPLPLILGVLALLALIWAGVRVFGGRQAPASPAPAVQTTTAPAAPEAGPAPPSAATRPAASQGSGSPGTVHEVIPDVPFGARRTIRGHIKVWVRVIVNQDGSVFAAVPDRAGPSRYFERQALDAAKKWTFPPADTPAQRIVQIHFDFSREGTTGRAMAVR